MQDQGIKVSGEHEIRLPDVMLRENERRGGHIRLASVSIHRGHEVTLMVPKQNGTVRSDTPAGILQVPRIEYLFHTILPAIYLPCAKRSLYLDVIATSGNSAFHGTRLSEERILGDAESFNMTRTSSSCRFLWSSR